MRSFALASLLASVTLVACVSAGVDDTDSTEAEVHLGTSPDAAMTADSAAPGTDASATVLDGGPAETDGSVPAVDAGPAVPTYAEVGPVIQTVCGRCHTANFSTLAKVKASRTRMLGVINSGRMPKGNPGWRNTEDGQRVIDFLTHSPELQ